MKTDRFMRQRPYVNSCLTGWHLSAMIRKPDGNGSPAREITGVSLGDGGTAI